jgi:hypothetical protein
MIEEVRFLFFFFRNGEKRKKENQTRGATFFVCRSFISNFVKKEKKKRKHTLKSTNAARLASLQLFLDWFRLQDHRESALLFFLFSPNFERINVKPNKNALGGKQMKMFCTLRTSQHVNPKKKKEKKKRAQAGLASATNFIASCVNTRLKRFVKNLKHTHTYLRMCVRFYDVYASRTHTDFFQIHISLLFGNTAMVQQRVFCSPF